MLMGILFICLWGLFDIFMKKCYNEQLVINFTSEIILGRGESMSSDEIF